MTQYPIIHINGQVSQHISVLDRGFAYGDGFFETCRVYNNKIHLWDLHLKRILNTAKQLLIPIEKDLLENQIQHILQKNNLEHAVLKIQITRGETSRGYSFPENLLPNYILFLSETSHLDIPSWLDGVTVGICNIRLSSNPTLAGLKHLNRLENVLARAELKSESSEGLLLDQQNNLIEGTMSNLFLVKDNTLVTPDLTAAGVCGVMREAIMTIYAVQLNIPVIQKKLTLDDMGEAEEIFLCNSLIGIWPVRKCVREKTSVFALGEVTRKLQVELIRHVTL